MFKKNPTAAPQAIRCWARRPEMTESPNGWLGTGTQTTFNISGNNAHAYLDTDANNSPDAGGATVSGGNFTTAANLQAQPSTTANKAVAVQNLFYLNNVIHDALYRHGFDEAQANFQIDNFGNGGLGNDPVNAEAQDGSGTDNANFATPADGSSPRMQMYLWNPPNTHQVVVNSTQYRFMKRPAPRWDRSSAPRASRRASHSSTTEAPPRATLASVWRAIP